MNFTWVKYQTTTQSGPDSQESFQGGQVMRLHHRLDIIWKRSLPQLLHQPHWTAIYLEYVSRRDVSRWRMLSEAPRTYCVVHSQVAELFLFPHHVPYFACKLATSQAAIESIFKGEYRDHEERRRKYEHCTVPLPQLFSSNYTSYYFWCDLSKYWKWGST